MIINRQKQAKIYVDSLLVLIKKNPNIFPSSLLQNFFKIGSELFLLNAFICSSKKTKLFFLTNNSKDKAKCQILLELFPGLSNLTKNFLNILAQKKQIYLFFDINNFFQEKLKNFQKIIKVKLVISYSFKNKKNTNDNLKIFYTLLFNLLQNSFKSSHFILDIVYDPTILGGIILQQENYLVDLSIKSKLKNLVNS